MTARLAVNPVRNIPTLSSLLLLRLVILVVFVAMSADKASSAVFIHHDTVAKVNICAKVIRNVDALSCLAITVSMIDSCPAVGVGTIVSSGICLDIRLYGLSE